MFAPGRKLPHPPGKAGQYEFSSEGCGPPSLPNGAV